MNSPVRAITRGLIALGALALGGTLVASPASAAEKYSLTPEVPSEVKVQVGGGAARPVSVVRKERFAATVNFAFTVDVAAFGGKVVVDGPGCTGAGTVYTCTFTHTFTAAEPEKVELGNVGFSVADDAVPASRKLTWRMTSDASDPAETEQYLTVADNGSLYTDVAGEVQGSAGGKVPVPLSVRNGGSNEVRNAALRFTLKNTVTPTSLPSNCRRQARGDDFDYACFFETPLAAGKSYKLTSPLELAVAAGTTGDVKMSYSWEPYKRGDRMAWEPGSGPALTLTTTSTAPAGKYNYSSVLIRLSGQRKDDLALTATAITGKAGTEADLTFTIANTGPVKITTDDGPAVAGVAYTLPKGVTAKNCEPIAYSPDPALKGMCKVWPQNALELDAGKSVKVTVKVKLDQSVTGAKGSAALIGWDREEGAPFFHGDADKANDRVELAATFTGTGPLAKTGVSLPVTAGFAAVLVVSGGAALALTRRR
ncbi:hypothetical protein Afil01_16790 [Actinorhabdospora filicis]|uniref:DUF11 domain-containing protein n=1 Tax=Actinorhabdospora filicis TaxID=1785913 RepID=A0A9W6SJ26_9ACTN|nr:hypothetical protein [Actinorhabdospora filicis]GLZ76872.1 hypothetical protein Afil01_16790 [Actinorhabdospora filicis]